MKIALIGASGFVGTAILQELTDRHHTVTAIVRHPEKINIKNDAVIAVKGDVVKADELAEILKEHDAVISAYNPGWANPDLYAEFIAGSQSIQEAVKRSGVKRLIVIGGAGSLYIAPGVQLVDTPQFPEEWKAGATAARDYLTFLQKEEALDWTFFSPAIEMHPGTSGIRKATFRIALDNPIFDEHGKSVLSVEDLAVAIVDEAEQPRHIKQRFTAAY